MKLKPRNQFVCKCIRPVSFKLYNHIMAIIHFTAKSRADRANLTTPLLLLEKPEKIHEMLDVVHWYPKKPGFTALYTHNTTDSENRTIHEAMQHWENNTCVRFKPHSNQTYYVRFFPGSG